MKKRHRKRRKFAKLTHYEDHCWTFAFCYYKDAWHASDAVADKYAWRDMLMEFPRLRAYDGCE
jgi:hypothetical protein